jgi:hypothetical protein
MRLSRLLSTTGLMAAMSMCLAAANEGEGRKLPPSPVVGAGQPAAGLIAALFVGVANAAEGSGAPAGAAQLSTRGAKAAIKGEAPSSSRLPAVQQGSGAQGTGNPAALKIATPASAKVPAVQSDPGRPATKQGLKGTGNPAASKMETPASAKVPAVQQGLTSKGGGKAHSQVPAVQVHPGPPEARSKAAEAKSGFSAKPRSGSTVQASPGPPDIKSGSSAKPLSAPTNQQ